MTPHRTCSTQLYLYAYWAETFPSEEFPNTYRWEHAWSVRFLDESAARQYMADIYDVQRVKGVDLYADPATRSETKEVYQKWMEDSFGFIFISKEKAQQLMCMK